MSMRELTANAAQPTIGALLRYIGIIDWLRCRSWMLRDRRPIRPMSHPLLHKVVSRNYSCTVHFDHSIRRAHAPHRSLGCRTQERRKPHSGLPWAKNRNTPRSSPARSAQMPRNPTREAGSSWNVPDASADKNPCYFRVSSSAIWWEGIISDYQWAIIQYIFWLEHSIVQSARH